MAVIHELQRFAAHGRIDREVLVDVVKAIEAKTGQLLVIEMVNKKAADISE